MESLIRWVSERTIPDTGLRAKLDREFRNLYKLITSQQSVIAALQTAIASVGTTTTATSFNIRGASQAVVAGSNTIVFSSPMTTSTYALSIRAKYSDGRETEVIESSKSQTGFVISVVEAGMLNYIAVENA